MKKYITLFTFICVLFLGIQTAAAQESAEIRAKEKALKLEKRLELSSDQVKKVYEIYLSFEGESSAGDYEALTAAQKKISAVLSPKQREKFNRSIQQSRMRQEKKTRANRQ